MWEQFTSSATAIVQSTDTPSLAKQFPAPTKLDSLRISRQTVLEFVAIANRAVIEETRQTSRPIIPHTHQIAAAIAYFHGYRVLEMCTGEGKSVVTLLVASVLVLCGEKVHIATSNDLLSERDCQFMKGTLTRLGSPMVMTTTQAREAERADKRRQRGGGDSDVTLLLDAHPGTVLFGTMHELMAFSLYGSKEVLKELEAGAAGIARAPRGILARSPRREWCLLIDEIDFLICNAMQNVTQLSVTTFGTEELFCLTSALAVAIVQCQQYGGPTSLNELRRYMMCISQNQIREARDKFKTLSPRQQRLLWYTLASRVDSAIEVMRGMGESVDFVVNPNKGIVAVSQETGLLEDDVVFGLGRDQLLAMLHQQFLYGESVVSRTLSVPSQFASLYKSIGGWSGTLGNDENCNFITRVIGRTTRGAAEAPQWLRIPSSFASSRRTLLPPCLTDSPSQHFDVIYEMLRAALVTRPGGGHSEEAQQPRCGAVLILFDTIQTAERFHGERLVSMEGGAGHESGIFPVLITRNGEHSVPTEALPLGTVIVTTMLMHRGEDLKLSDNVVAAGGLLEIDTFVGQSEKTDRQKWGRVARHGQPGTVVQVVDRSTCPFAGGFVQSYDSIIDLRNFGESLTQVCNDGANMVNLSRIDLWNLRAQIAIKDAVRSPALTQEALDLWGYQMDLIRSFSTRLYYDQLMSAELNSALDAVGLAVDVPISYPSQSIALSAMIDRLCRFPRNTIFRSITKAKLLLDHPPSVEIDDQFLYQCSCVTGRPILVITYSAPHQKDRWSFDDLRPDDEGDESANNECGGVGYLSCAAVQHGFNAKLYYCSCCRESAVEAMLHSEEFRDSSKADAESAAAPLEMDLNPIYLFRLRSGKEMFCNGEKPLLHALATGTSEGSTSPTSEDAALPLMSCVLSMLYGADHHCTYSCEQVPTHVPACYGSLEPLAEETETVLCDMLVRRMGCTAARSGNFCLNSMLQRENDAPDAATVDQRVRNHFAALGTCLSAWNDKTAFVTYFSDCVEHFISALPAAAAGGMTSTNGLYDDVVKSAFLAPSPAQMLFSRDATDAANFEVHYARSERQFPCHLPQLYQVRLRHLGKLQKAERNGEVVEYLQRFVDASTSMQFKWDYLMLLTQLPRKRGQRGRALIAEEKTLNPMEKQLLWIAECCEMLRTNAISDLEEMQDCQDVKTRCASAAVEDVLLNVIPEELRTTVGAEIATRIGCWSTRVSAKGCRDPQAVRTYLCLAGVRLGVGLALTCTVSGLPAGSYLLRTVVDDILLAYQGNTFSATEYLKQESFKIALSGVTSATKAGYTFVKQGDRSMSGARAAAAAAFATTTKGRTHTIASGVVNAVISKASVKVFSEAQGLLQKLAEDNDLLDCVQHLSRSIHEPGMHRRRETVLKMHLLQRQAAFREKLTQSLPRTLVSKLDHALSLGNEKGVIGAVASGLHDVVEEKNSGVASSTVELSVKTALAAGSLIDLWCSDIRGKALEALDEETRILEEKGWMRKEGDDNNQPAIDAVNDYVFYSLLWLPRGTEIDAATREQVRLVQKLLVEAGYLDGNLSRSGAKVAQDTDVFKLRKEMAELLRPHLPDRRTTDKAVNAAALLLRKIQKADSIAACEALFQPLYNRIQSELDAYSLGELKSAVTQEVCARAEQHLVTPAMEYLGFTTKQPREGADGKREAVQRGKSTNDTGGGSDDADTPDIDAVHARQTAAAETDMSERLLVPSPQTKSEFQLALFTDDFETITNSLYPLKIQKYIDTISFTPGVVGTARAPNSLQDLSVLLRTPDSSWAARGASAAKFQGFVNSQEWSAALDPFEGLLKGSPQPVRTFDELLQRTASDQWVTTVFAPPPSDASLMINSSFHRDKTLDWINQLLGLAPEKSGGTLLLEKILKDLPRTSSSECERPRHSGTTTRNGPTDQNAADDNDDEQHNTGAEERHTSPDNGDDGSAAARKQRRQQVEEALMQLDYEADVIEGAQDAVSDEELRRMQDAYEKHMMEVNRAVAELEAEEAAASGRGDGGDEQRDDDDDGDDTGAPYDGDDNGHGGGSGGVAGAVGQGLETAANVVRAIDEYDKKGAEFIQHYTGLYIRPTTVLEYAVTFTGGAGILVQGFRMGGKYMGRRVLIKTATTYGKHLVKQQAKKAAYKAGKRALDVAAKPLVGERNYNNVTTIVDGVMKAQAVYSNYNELVGNVNNIGEQLSKETPNYRTTEAKAKDGVRGLRADGSADRRYTKNTAVADEGIQNHVYYKAAAQLNVGGAVTNRVDKATDDALSTALGDTSQHRDAGANQRTAASSRAEGSAGGDGGSDTHYVYATYVSAGARKQQNTHQGESRSVRYEGRDSTKDRGESVARGSGLDAVRTQAVQLRVGGSVGSGDSSSAPTVGTAARRAPTAREDNSTVQSPQWQAAREGLSAFYVACYLANLVNASSAEGVYALDVESLRSLHDRLALSADPSPQPVDVLRHLKLAKQLLYVVQGQCTDGGDGVTSEELLGGTGSPQNAPGAVVVQLTEPSESLRLPEVFEGSNTRYTFVSGVESASLDGEEADNASHFAVTSTRAHALMGLYMC